MLSQVPGAACSSLPDRGTDRGTLLAATVLPVHTGALVLCAPGIALAAGAVALSSRTRSGLFAAGSQRCSCRPSSCSRSSSANLADEDWRSLASAVKRVKGGRETVVVVPGALTGRLRLLRALRRYDELARGRRSLDRRRERRRRRRSRRPPAWSDAPTTPSSGSSSTARTCGCSTGCGHNPGDG